LGDYPYFTNKYGGGKMEIMTCFAKANLKAKEQVLSELMQDFSSSSVDIRHDDISAATLKWMILCNRNDTVYLREKSFAEGSTNTHIYTILIHFTHTYIQNTH
jgi:hypothetical protein